MSMALWHGEGTKNAVWTTYLVSSFDLGSLSRSLRGLSQPRVPFGLYCGIVTDAGLKELAGLTQLQSLNLHNTKVTDAGLKELARD